MQLNEYLNNAFDLIKQIPEAQVNAFMDAITEAYQADKPVFLIGNGGSGANASHICEDLGKGTLHDFENQKRLKVMSLTDNTPYILAWGNDTDYSRIFVEQLKNFAEPGALLIAISGSGNSPNVIAAVEYAKANGIKVFGFTGYDGGKLKPMCDAFLHVPSFNMGLVESVHMIFFHYMLEELHERFKTLS